MARLVLVHGSNHGAWCWRDVVPALGARGHEALAVDLPSVAAEPASLAGVTLDDDARAILAAFEGPAVLVGHSAGGYAIARAAGLAPDRVTGLVYLCAYVPRAGATLAGLAREAPGRPLDGALEIDRVRGAYRFREPALAANLYGDCPAAALAYARPRLGWQSIAAQSQVVAPPSGLPASYIVCTGDRTIPPAQQRSMAAVLGPDRIHEIDTGHSPFFAAPERLAALIDGILRGG